MVRNLAFCTHTPCDSRSFPDFLRHWNPASNTMRIMHSLLYFSRQDPLDELTDLDPVDVAQFTKRLMHFIVQFESHVLALETHLSSLLVLFTGIEIRIELKPAPSANVEFGRPTTWDDGPPLAHRSLSNSELSADCSL